MVGGGFEPPIPEHESDELTKLLYPTVKKKISLEGIEPSFCCHEQRVLTIRR